MTTKKKAPMREPRSLATARMLDALRKTNPMAWREKILDAIRSKAGNVAEAADFLGIGRRTLNRLKAEDPALESGIEKIRQRTREERAEA